MPKERSSGETALFIMVITQSKEFFNWFLPPAYEIQTTEGVNFSEAYIRRGEIQAAGTTLLIGAVSSIIFEDAMPFLGMMIATAFLLFQYENALRTRSANP